MDNEFTIRTATEADTATILGFIRKMAEYEKLTHQVDTDEASLKRALFDEHQAEVVLGEVAGKPVGMALFFHNFSTFKGRHGLYLEDLFVDREYRGRGYGKALLLHLVGIARERGCRRMEWVALDWNQPAIDFYQSLGAEAHPEWVLFRLDEDKIAALSQK